VRDGFGGAGRQEASTRWRPQRRQGSRVEWPWTILLQAVQYMAFLDERAGPPTQVFAVT